MPATWSLEDIDGTNGFRIPGIQIGDRAGYVAAAGDFNNDGYADLLRGAPLAWLDAFYGGVCHVIYGGPNVGAGGEFDVGTLEGTNGFAIIGTTPEGQLGQVMAGVDFNGDGISDIAVSLLTADVAGRIDCGQVYVLYGGRRLGATGEFRPQWELTPALGVRINGIASGDAAGWGLAAAGDFNGDGCDDLIISAVGPAVPRPDVYLVFGGADAGGETGSIELSSLGGSNGFAIVRPRAGAVYDRRLAGLGDVNGDGYAEIAVPSSTGWLGVVLGGGLAGRFRDVRSLHTRRRQRVPYRRWSRRIQGGRGCQ
jgi:hypothetical protein